MSTSCSTTQRRLLRQHIRDLSLSCPQSVPAACFNSRPSRRTFIAPLTAQDDRDHLVWTGVHFCEYQSQWISSIGNGFQRRGWLGKKEYLRLRMAGQGQFRCKFSSNRSGLRNHNGDVHDLGDDLQFNAPEKELRNPRVTHWTISSAAGDLAGRRPQAARVEEISVVHEMGHLHERYEG